MKIKILKQEYPFILKRKENAWKRSEPRKIANYTKTAL